MKTYLIADTHFNPDNIETYCQRPADFTRLLVREWANAVHPEDTIIHLGDVAIGNYGQFVGNMLNSLPGRKILVRGNHDRKHSNSWWMTNGFDFACDAMLFRNAWLTHEPSRRWPPHAEYNIHGHLHNCWTGFGKFPRYWAAGQRLFAVEYTKYRPVEFEKFISHPDKFQAAGPV